MTKDARILVADDDPQMQLAIKACLSRAGYGVTITADGKDALEALMSSQFDLVISDQRMPEMTGQELLASMQERNIAIPFIMITAHGTVTQAVEAMQLGAADFITKPFDSNDLERVVERVLALDPREFKTKGKKSQKHRAIITNDKTMIRILEVAEAVSKSDATILIQGESGTGKELVARLIHTASPRASQTFVAVNCAALPNTLLESELFGHEKGAFTGAQQRKIGKFELAHGGTILLDEISEMDLQLQAKLLRVLQEREVDRVGGAAPIAIDVRVVATTNRNLELEVQAGRFRADLYYRLNVIPLTLPALRQRAGDIKLLVHHFIRQFVGHDMDIPGEVMSALEQYTWPGNIRELQNAVERGAILCRGGTPRQADFLLGIDGNSTLTAQIETIREPEQAQHIPSESEGTEPSIPRSAAGSSSKMIRSGLTVAEVEKALIIETLQDCQFNRTQAAKLLGISIRTLRNKLAEYRAGGEQVGVGEE